MAISPRSTIPLMCLALARLASGQTVTYDLLSETPLLDANFYAGEAIDGSDVAGRSVLWGTPSNDGRQVAFVAFNRSTFQMSIFLVDVGDPISWKRLSSDRSIVLGPLHWAPNNRSIFWRNERISLSDGQYQQHIVHGYLTFDPAPTRLARRNWLASNDGLFGDILLLPINRVGNEDLSRQPVRVTQLGIDISWQAIASDGSALTFSHYQQSSPADISDVYVLKNLQQIINAPKVPGTDVSALAPTSLSDPNIVHIRSSESANFAHCMSFSEDGSLVIFCEDFNNVFNDNDFFNTASAADFDIMISNADGSGSDFRLQENENQALGRVFPGGMRITYIRAVSEPFDVHNFVATLQVTTLLSGSVSGNNDLTLTSDQIARDGSGTQVFLESGTFIDFSPTVSQAISIHTPLNPVTQNQLPPSIDDIRVVRTFGPSNTTFTPPIQITMRYTDAEMRGLDEDTITPLVLNELSNIFDEAIPELDIIERNPAQNYVVFEIDHFSTIGLGAQFIALPIASRALELILVLVLGVVVVTYLIVESRYSRWSL